MKYLKSINENAADIFLSELEDDCNTNLAYLLDNDFNVIYRMYNRQSPYDVKIVIEHLKNLNFSWEEIKDNFIPFIHFINKKYCITTFSSYSGTGIVTVTTEKSVKIKKNTFDVEMKNITHRLSLKDIMDDNIIPNTEFRHLELNIAGYRYIPK